MNYTNRIAEDRCHSQRAIELLKGKRLLICMGSLLNLALITSTIPTETRLQAVTGEEEAMALLERHPCDLLLCTDTLEQGSGDRLVQRAKQRWPRLRTLLIVSRPHRQAAIRRVSQAGCDGICLEQNMGLGTVATALSTINGGGVYIDRSLWECYLQHYPGSHTLPATPLTERECEVLQLISQGTTNQEIGERLFLSTETVKTHVRRILHKLNARDRTHAAVIGLWLGLVDWPDSR